MICLKSPVDRMPRVLSIRVQQVLRHYKTELGLELVSTFDVTVGIMVRLIFFQLGASSNRPNKQNSRRGIKTCSAVFMKKGKKFYS